MPDLSEILTHLGEERADYLGAMVPPVYQTSNFAFPDLDSFKAAFSDEPAHHLYSRGNNPTVAILRQKLAALEGTEDSLVFSSGAAAVSATVVSLLQAGEHLICVQKPYSWTNYLLTELLPRYGVEVTFVDGQQATNFEQALQENTKLVFLESPNSLTFELQDLAAVADFCRKNELVSLIDNSHCSPIFQRPHEFGIDLIIHSATKYLCGHSDVVMGVVCGSQANIRRIFLDAYMCLGAVPTAQAAGLALRGLRTLDLRIRRSDATAFELAKRLQAHPRVRKVYHPLLPDSPQFELAQRQMSGGGGLLTIVLDSDSKQDVTDFVSRIERFLLAVSWGGYESLMVPTLTFYDQPGKPDPPFPFQMIRFYVGIEDIEYLWTDLHQALAQLP